jgi:hypothetical protein
MIVKDATHEEWMQAIQLLLRDALGIVQRAAGHPLEKVEDKFQVCLHSQGQGYC